MGGLRVYFSENILDRSVFFINYTEVVNMSKEKDVNLVIVICSECYIHFAILSGFEGKIVCPYCKRGQLI